MYNMCMWRWLTLAKAQRLLNPIFREGSVLSSKVLIDRETAERVKS